MFAKTNGSTVVKYPYTVGDLRRDNPNVSFPKSIGDNLFRRYGVVRVHTVDDPSYDTVSQKVVTAKLPSRETSGTYTAETAPDENMVGEPIYTGRWILAKTVVDLTAEEQTEWDNTVATRNRNERNKRLAATDHFGLSDVSMTAEMITYRQALRDLPSNATNWPHLSDDDWPTKP